MHTSPGAELVYSGIFGQGGGLSAYLEAMCTGNETSFLQCPSMYYYTCSDHTHDIGIRCAPGLYTCSCSCLHMILDHYFIMLSCLNIFVLSVLSSLCLDGDIRLVYTTNGTIGPDIIEGMVEICYGGRWGVVTGSAWTLSEASVVCRQLDYAPVALKALVYSRDIAPAGSITFSHFYCAGYELNILDCYHDPPGYYNYYDNPFSVAVRCQGK